MRLLVAGLLVLLLGAEASAATIRLAYSPVPLPAPYVATRFRVYRCQGSIAQCPRFEPSHWRLVQTIQRGPCTSCATITPWYGAHHVRLSYYMTAVTQSGAQTLPSNMLSVWVP